MKGKTRDGINVPLLCNWMVKEVRMYKEYLPQYLGDMKTINPSQIQKGNINHHLPWPITIIFKILRSILFVLTLGRFVDIKIPPRIKRIEFHGFTYAIFLFAIKDPHTKDGVEIL